MQVSAVIPAYQEAQSISATVRSMVPLVDEIIVVDDGSTDETARYAIAAGAHRVIVLPKNMGKGAALARGAYAAQGDVLCFVDADLKETAAEFAKLLAPVLAGKADMAVAAWPKGGRRAGFGLVVGLAALGIWLLTGWRPHSPLSGQRVMRRVVWENANLEHCGFGVEVGLTVETLRAGYRVMEVPVKMKHRVTGRNFRGFAHRGKQFIHVLCTLWRMWRRHGKRAS